MMKALIFDMDGTLTPATQAVSPKMMESISLLRPWYKKYLVSGSDMEKIERQMSVEFLLSNFDKVFACNGTSVYNTR